MTHRNNIFGLLAALLLVATAAHAEDTLTEKKITAMTDAIEAAVRRHDAGAIVRHFAPGATIQIVMPPNAGGQTLTLSVKQYEQMLREGWAQYSQSTYRVEDAVIEISADGQTARLTNTTIEAIQMQGRTLSSRTREDLSVALVNGRPVITKSVGRVMMEVGPASQR